MSPLSQIEGRQPAEVVAEMFWDEGYSAERTVAAAELAGELVRYLNHATRHAEALPDPAAVAAVVGATTTLIGRLPQLLEQTASTAHAMAKDTRLRVDDLGPVPAGGAAQMAADAGRALSATAYQVDEAYQQMVRAAGPRTSRLYLAEAPTMSATADAAADGW